MNDIRKDVISVAETTIIIIPFIIIGAIISENIHWAYGFGFFLFSGILMGWKSMIDFPIKKKKESEK